MRLDDLLERVASIDDRNQPFRRGELDEELQVGRPDLGISVVDRDEATAGRERLPARPSPRR